MPEILHLIGLIFDVVGVILLANAVFSTVRWRSWPCVFMSALVRGNVAKGTARLEFHTENVLTSLQGLAFVIIGFIFAAIGMIMKIIGEYLPCF